MEPALFALPAQPGRESEDACALGEGIAVVVDGAGLPKSSRRGCGHSVAWYARMLAEAFRVRLEDRTTRMTDALAGAIGEVTAAHADACDLALGSPSATVAAWRITGDQIEHLVLCDASIVVVTADGGVREITDARIDDAVRRRAAQLAAQAGIAEAPAEMRFRALDQMRNVDGGFWCAHTDPGAARHALTGRTPVADLRAIVAASDGGTRGYQWLAAHSIERFAELAVQERLGEIADEIRAAEAGAPVRVFTKPHDDITLVALTR
ncbi:protein phosphatase 2C domain-containing protein [Microbacterium esteraromaticum]|uniref:protein phosphatase 2C domain-containing protein n=1 Tax=Microbacterium esteraromaticum TaxID=57043 RepID=UPI0019D3978A|nr:protein phosphatase 2C domain-containing protein [Microbacterium esteraromaticum]MBN7794507.1 protein phosphatase 2C domain-containing protein [Microbacterium esteraromaticum]